MQYVHIKNLEKFHPGYKDRQLQWAKIYINMAEGDPDCEFISNEIDWARFVKMILFELRAQKPLPNDDSYWIKKGFNLKKRSMSLTLQVLHNFIDIVTEPLHCFESSVPNLLHREEKEESNIKREDNIKAFDSFELSLLNSWNAIVDKAPMLSKIERISTDRRNHLKTRFMSEHFRANCPKAIESIPKYEFLLGKNKSGWKASFDWLIYNDTNYLKVIEGKYGNNDKDEAVLKKWGKKDGER